MNEFVLQNAEDYLAFHEMDIQNSTDLVGIEHMHSIIPTEAVKKTRKTLGLNLEMFSILLGLNLATMIRYENLSLPPYPQGHASRKIGILINWLADKKSSQDIMNLLRKPNGLATLSGLLQSESVSTFLHMNERTADYSGENGDGGFNRSRVVGNA
jgi:hypothetical protein